MPRKTEISEVNIVETEKAKLKEPLVVLGFAGAGLVGGIAVSHIIDQLKMKEIAHVRSRYIPPAVVFMDGKLRHPFRIYSDEEGKLSAVVCEIPLRSDGSYPIASTLLDWAEEKRVKQLVVLEGFAVRGIPKERKSFCAAEPEKRKECEEKGVKMITAGIIRGIAGSILNECLTRKITGVAFMVPAFAFMPDPEGAAVLIKTLNHVYDLHVDTENLLKEAEKIKQKLKEVAEHHRRMRKAEERRGVPESSYVA
ncbi:proteasome assembly chaperone family protein [Candidatus Bathyarchaeota archaeon]|nr:proteasome assembly chaperone family protein [Candidatus Bathyarchaeota archaeon]